MAKKKKAAKKKVAKKKAAKKKVAKKKNGGEETGFWFSDVFEEGHGGDSQGNKRKLIQEFYKGYIHFYNQHEAHPTTYNLEDDFFDWSIVHPKPTGVFHKVDIYLSPAPPPPGAGVSDPPPPKKPPPQMG